MADPQHTTGMVADDTTFHGRPERGQNRDKIAEGPWIEDVTDEGYEADDDAAYPDGFEDPAESDRETERPKQAPEKVSRQPGLIRRFQKLRCSTDRPEVASGRARVPSEPGSLLKRNHSEGSLTSTDEPVEETTGTTPEHRAKRRTLSPAGFKLLVSDGSADTLMDVDEKASATTAA